MIHFKTDASMKSLSAVDKDQLIVKIYDLIRTLNHGYEYDKSLAEEWVHYLQLLLDGHKENLENPYGDIDHYDVSSFSQSTPGLDQIDSLYMLDDLPDAPPTSQHLSHPKLQKSLFITALGGIDSTFYKGLSSDESIDFANSFFSPDLVKAFHNYKVVHLIPRGFVAKKSATGASLTNTESMILQAYAAGIRNIAVIANAMTRQAIDDFMQEKFSALHDLNILVTAQPLLPRIKVENGDVTISLENGAYPGGHGHGFKYCLNDSRVQNCIKKNGLKYFLFTNGDNAAVLNWGGDHFEAVLNKLEALKKMPGHKNLRIGFFLVWEYLRKGGFSFLLRDKQNGRIMPQIFEAELAEKSGADIHKLETSRGGYNTNVAIGILQDVYAHLAKLPMVLKSKHDNKTTFYSFEASLATAITTFQEADGRSKFDPQSAINILGPKPATYQHWNHIALRKRDDLFAFHSSLFKIEKLEIGSESYPFILTHRDATQKHPTLDGNFVDPDVLNTKGFFDIFVDATFDVEDFYGTIRIDLLDAGQLPRGSIKFEKNITLIGDEDSIIECSVPAGEKWIISAKTFKADKKRTITPDDATVLKWNAATARYF